MRTKTISKERNQIHNCILCVCENFDILLRFRKVINQVSGFNFLTSDGSGYGSTMQKVTIPLVPVPVPQVTTLETRIENYRHQA